MENRQITKGPRHHWFGYYDKLQFSPDNRLVLGMEVGFEHRTPRPGESVTVGVIDLEDGDRWTPLGESQAWGWQQGCMLQWVPGMASTILWNDRVDDAYVGRILDVETGERRTIGSPVYALSPDGRTAVSADFSRIQALRPGYGYVGLPDRIGDINYGGHLGNDAVLSLIHEARCQFLGRLGLSESDVGGAGIVLADCVIQYRSEAFYGETLKVAVVVGDFTRSGFDLFYRLMEQESGREVARAKTAVTCFDYEKRRPAKTPEGLKERLG